MNVNAFESLITINLGFKELIKTMIELIEKRSEKNKKQFVDDLQRDLQEVSFHKIKDILKKIINEGEISVPSRSKLIDWYTNTADSLEAAISKLEDYYIPSTSNDSKTGRSQRVSLPREWNAIQTFSNLKFGKQKLREDVQNYITTGATRFCEVLKSGTYIACFRMRSQLKNQILLRI
ncbi:hypothetical protein NIES4072_65200 [Nostoc commune NIES-4072]|uniref:Uncharacterized protein n=1 Tax=Nostoc commune NIES-4072 TaxID=2005467 RepID=A0A2R5FZB2_NOSCO|nr:hypothetical protein [Nostoc commune]BBD70155.1 hypothetical protein NIES4070_65660 [Nostoc commune HK-02]GBG22808.1 hypothetical protein NIES4072_65200 [Nostoc commune NIES-4072]